MSPRLRQISVLGCGALLAACSTSYRAPPSSGSERTVEMPEPDVRVIVPKPRKPTRDVARQTPPKPRKGPAPRFEKDRGPEAHEIPEGMANIPDPVPTFEPLSRGGNAKSYTVFGKRYHTLRTAEGYKERGLASWYGKKFHGRKTSNGERYDMFTMTAAHKTLPLPTYVWVTNLDNGRRVVVRVNDRGPFHPGRIIDLSYAAATRLDCVGVIPRVEVEAITPEKWAAHLRQERGESLASVESTIASSKPVSKGEMLWQVGAFQDAINAVQTRERMREQGFESVDIRVGTNAEGSTIHLVLVGPFAGRREVERAHIQIRSIGYEPILVHQ